MVNFLVARNLSKEKDWQSGRFFCVDYTTSSKKKTNDEVASLTSADPPIELKPVTIDEALIDQTLNAIHDADPEGERPDPHDLLELEGVLFYGNAGQNCPMKNKN